MNAMQPGSSLRGSTLAQASRKQFDPLRPFTLRDLGVSPVEFRGWVHARAFKPGLLQCPGIGHPWAFSLAEALTVLITQAAIRCRVERQELPTIVPVCEKAIADADVQFVAFDSRSGNAAIGASCLEAIAKLRFECRDGPVHSVHLIDLCAIRAAHGELCNA